MSSNTTTLSTSATNNACHHPLGFTADQMAQIDRGGSVPAITINVYALAGPPGGGPIPGLVLTQSPKFSGSSGLATTILQYVQVGLIGAGQPASAVYTRMESADAEDFGFSSSSLPLFTEPLLADDAYFACTASNSSVAGYFFGLLSPTTDLGSSLTLSSGSKILKLPKTPNFFPVYQASVPNPPTTSTPDALPPPFFTPGQWQVSGPGSAAVKPFQASALFPPQIRATNFSNLTTIDRQRDQTITWDPTGYNDSDVATLTLSATQSITQGFTTTTSNESVTCRAHASAGQVTIPSSLLAAFAPSASGNSTAFAELRVAPRSNQGVVFPISLADGNTMPGVIRYSFAELWPVTFQ
ncbi:MAG TPA: hypothetical protein VN541_16990 [Tepidisphaeraceae bacterium]|nr:hypothetical protein [Tepidisphaeraceae bacterium]